MTAITAESMPTAAAARTRLQSVDLLRGLIIVIMALDHVREHFSNVAFEPTDLAHTNPAFFFTRWITHFCAPVFVLLAGTGAGLSLQAGKTKQELAWFLLTRGAWLALLELTVVKWLFIFQIAPGFYLLQVIWVIGVSMMALAGLIFLPRSIIIAFGAALVLGHNLFDGLGASTDAVNSALARDLVRDPLVQLWMVLHAPGMMQVGDVRVLVLYPLLPWMGVCALGYALADVYRMEAAKRQRWLLRAGIGLTATFFAFRLINIYGDPEPWSVQHDAAMTIVSFFNVAKYPPSLAYLLMTLGPALMVLSMAERWSGRIANFFVTFGRVPLFFYVAHLAVVHSGAVIFGVATGFAAQDFFTRRGLYPEAYGTGLIGVYLVWALIVAALYWPCVWWGEMKRRNKSPLFSYL